VIGTLFATLGSRTVMLTDVVVNRHDADGSLRWAGHCLESRGGAVYYDNRAITLEQDLPTDWFAFVRQITGSVFMPLGARWLELGGVPAACIGSHEGTVFNYVPEAHPPTAWQAAKHTIEARSGALLVDGKTVDQDALFAVFGNPTLPCLAMDWAVFANRLALLAMKH
jgi:hypothetical protein